MPHIGTILHIEHEISLDSLAVAIAARADAIYLCREGAVPVITTADVHTWQTHLQIPSL